MVGVILANMVNTDKVKAARSGSDIKYHQKVTAIHNAERASYSENKRLSSIHNHLRSCEDAGKGVSTGAQYEHEERMRERKAKLDAKKAKSKAFFRSLNAMADDEFVNAQGDADSSEDAATAAAASSHNSAIVEPTRPPLRFAVGDRVRCCVAPDQWAGGRVARLWYREDAWPVERVAPYQVALDDGELIFAPADDDDVIRAEKAIEQRAVDPRPATSRHGVFDAPDAEESPSAGGAAPRSATGTAGAAPSGSGWRCDSGAGAGGAPGRGDAIVASYYY